MSTNIKPIRKNASATPFNSPLASVPEATVSVTLRDLIALGAQQQVAQQSTPRFDDGYRRYLHCDLCNTQMQIFTCWHGSPKSCDPKRATHTHVTCKCEDRAEHPIVFAGSVKFRTKQDEKSIEGEVVASATPTVEV